MYLTLLVWLLSALFTFPPDRPAGKPSQQEARAVRLVFDVVASERDGTPATGLTAGDFVATVDGKPATVVAARQIFRGPGSLVAAAQYGRRGGPSGPASFAAWAETSRAVVIAIDSTSLARGDEKATLDVAARLLDRLGAEDRIGIVSLPVGDGALALDTEHPAQREALRKITARPWAPEVHDPKMTVVEALQIARGDRQALKAVSERYEVDAERPADATLEAEAQDVMRQCRDHADDTLGQVAAMAGGLAALRGRKTLLLLTSGSLVDASATGVQAAAMAASEARMAVYVVQLPSRSETAVRSLADLAQKTGGTAVSVQKNRDDALERLARELSAIYELTVAPIAALPARGRAPIAVGTPRKTLVTRSAAWAQPGVEENVGVSAPAQPQPEAPVNPPAVGAERRVEPAAAAGKDPLLAVVLGRAAEYVGSYRRDFSSAIAEERYEQARTGSALGTTGPSRRTLRSEFLLLRRTDNTGWIPFRDVLEVDGKPVQDRPDRLKKLFLEHPETALDQANEISTEGARYNLGPVVRNINVPLVPLGFLDPEPSRRFSFSRHGQDTVEGIQAWRIDYVEKARPTIIRTADPKPSDVPTDGAFWIDPLTGRVLKTTMTARGPGVVLETTVTYKPDQVLGIWVPAEMRESYSYSLGGPTSAAAGTITGKATYSNFRRFAVTTEEKVKIK
jgi:hypothetical protein